jgi:nucleoside-triphosphatase THEP1
MNEKLQKIAAILGITLSNDVVEENLSAEAKLMDGTVVKTEADGFIVGATVMVVLEDGAEVPAAAGEHVLEDGTIIVVDEAGVIMEVKPKAEEPAEEEELSDDKEEENDEPVAFALSEEDYNALVERIAKLEEVLLGAVEALSNTNKELNEKVEALSAQPAAQPIKTRKPVVEENALAAIKLPKRK